MDESLARLLEHLAAHLHKRQWRVPIGFLGGQAPSAFGGFDWYRLAKTGTFFEAYDHGMAPRLIHDFALPGTKVVSTLFLPEDGSASDRVLVDLWQGFCARRRRCGDLVEPPRAERRGQRTHPRGGAARRRDGAAQGAAADVAGARSAEGRGPGVRQSPVRASWVDARLLDGRRDLGESSDELRSGALDLDPNPRSLG